MPKQGLDLNFNFKDLRKSYSDLLMFCYMKKWEPIVEAIFSAKFYFPPLIRATNERPKIIFLLFRTLRTIVMSHFTDKRRSLVPFTTLSLSLWHP